MKILKLIKNILTFKVERTRSPLSFDFKDK